MKSALLGYYAVYGITMPCQIPKECRSCCSLPMSICISLIPSINCFDHCCLTSVHLMSLSSPSPSTSVRHVASNTWIWSLLFLACFPQLHLFIYLFLCLLFHSHFTVNFSPSPLHSLNFVSHLMQHYRREYCWYSVHDMNICSVFKQIKKVCKRVLFLFLSHSAINYYFRTFTGSKVLFILNFVFSIESLSHRCVFWIQSSLRPSKCHIPFRLIFPPQSSFLRHSFASRCTSFRSTMASLDLWALRAMYCSGNHIFEILSFKQRIRDVFVWRRKPAHFMGNN